MAAQQRAYWFAGLASVAAISGGVAYAMEHTARAADRKALTYVQAAVELSCAFLENELNGTAKALAGTSDAATISALAADGRVLETTSLDWSQDYSVCAFPRQWEDPRAKNNDAAAFRALTDAVPTQRGPELAKTLQAMGDQVAALRTRPFAR